MHAVKRKRKPSAWARTRGGRISQRGYRLFYAGFAGNIAGGLATGLAHAPGPVIFVVLMLAFAVTLTGLCLAYAGARIGSRDLAEYYRRVEAGEIAPWKPGDPSPLP